QRTLDADVVETRDGVTRGVLVLEYIDGTPLDLFLNSNPRLPAEQVAALLRSFLCELIIAAWHEGWRFWDFRAANLVVARDGRRIVMIDTDSLSTSAPEVWDAPAAWAVRNEQEAKGFTRLPGLIAWLVGTCRREGEGTTRRLVRNAIERSELRERLHELGRAEAPEQREIDRAAALMAASALLAEVGLAG